MELTDETFLLLHRLDGRLVRLGMRDGVAYTMTAVVGLVHAGRITLSEDRDARLHVASADPTDDPVLNHTLAQLVAKHDGDRLARCIIDKHADPRDEIIKRLAAQGVIEIRSGSLTSLGASIYPQRSTAERERIITRLSTALRGETVPDSDDAAMLAAINGLGVGFKVLGDPSGLSRRELHQRIMDISREAPGGDAVRRIVASMNAIAAAGATA